MFAYIREHKGLAIGAVIAVVILFIVLRTRGSSSSSGAPAGVLVAGGTGGGDVGSATQVQQMQLQADFAAKQIDAQSRAASEQTAAQLELGKLAIGQAGTHDQLAATVATSNIDATAKLQSLLASISGDVEKTKSNNATQAANLANMIYGDIQKTTSNNQVTNTAQITNSATNQQKILSDALLSISGNQRDVALGGINANVDIARLNTNAATQISLSHDQTSGGLFGGGGFLGLGIG